MRSIASVPTQRPARYGKQLVSHMGRKIKGLWDGESGQLDFNGGGDVRLSSQDASLTLELSCEESEVDRLEYIVGVHLARFGSKDGLSVAWKREDGTEEPCRGLTAKPICRLSPRPRRLVWPPRRPKRRRKLRLPRGHLRQSQPRRLRR